MKRHLPLFLLLFVTLTGSLYYLFSNGTLLHTEVYEKYFRQAIFTSFLGIGSFVFALMTAILFNMKDKVFSTQEYTTIFRQSDNCTKHNESVYKPLTDIGGLFIYTVFSCITTAVAQITVGLTSNNIAASICISLAITTLLLILYVVYKVKRTMESWFRILLKSKLPEKFTD